MNEKIRSLVLVAAFLGIGGTVLYQKFLGPPLPSIPVKTSKKPSKAKAKPTTVDAPEENTGDKPKTATIASEPVTVAKVESPPPAEAVAAPVETPKVAEPTAQEANETAVPNEDVPRNSTQTAAPVTQPSPAPVSPPPAKQETPPPPEPTLAAATPEDPREHGLRGIIFAGLDSNNDRFLVVSELPARHHDRFAASDADSDGRLSFEEFDASIGSWKADPTLIPTPAALVTNEEEQSPAPAKSMAEKADKSAVKVPELIRKFDKDNDGQIGLYEWQGQNIDQFHRLDTNNDGFITPAEAQGK